MLRKLIAASLPVVPKPIVRKIAMRYVAGDHLTDGIETVRQLNGQGMTATLALLGEEVTERERVEEATQVYVDLAGALNELRSGVSIKPTNMGLKIDQEYCRDNLERVLESAAATDTFVRLDMEDHTTTDATIELYGQARERHEHLGIVFQAYLHRVQDDIAALPEGANVRLCKGIYIEPPEVAIQSYEGVRRNFVACLEKLFDRGAFVGIATHDSWLIDRALEIIEARQLDHSRYEFQTLLGVTEKKRDELVAAGHPLRVYVPYGEDWYLYSVRRLRENPQIGVYVTKALVGLG